MRTFKDGKVRSHVRPCDGQVSESVWPGRTPRRRPPCSPRLLLLRSSCLPARRCQPPCAGGCAGLPASYGTLPGGLKWVLLFVFVFMYHLCENYSKSVTAQNCVASCVSPGLRLTLLDLQIGLGNARSEWNSLTCRGLAVVTLPCGVCWSKVTGNNSWKDLRERWKYSHCVVCRVHMTSLVTI